MSTTVHVPPGEGRHYRMTDGDHIAKAAVHQKQHAGPWRDVIIALVDGTSYDVEPGGLVVFPAGTPSTFGVVGECARFVAITSGDSAGRFFADFANTVPVEQPIEDSSRRPPSGSGSWPSAASG